MNRIKHVVQLLNIFYAIFFISGCSKPDESKQINGPGNEIAYIIETNYGMGAATSDYTKIFAYPHDGKQSERILVLSGENLDIKKIHWKDKNNVEICLNGGITDHYTNQFMIGKVGHRVLVNNHLVENCKI